MPYPWLYTTGAIVVWHWYGIGSIGRTLNVTQSVGIRHNTLKPRLLRHYMYTGRQTHKRRSMSHTSLQQTLLHHITAIFILTCTLHKSKSLNMTYLAELFNAI